MLKRNFSIALDRLIPLAFRVLPTLFLMLAATQSINGISVVKSDPLIGATKTDTLLQDNNGNSQVDPGDSLRYTVVITNNGTTDASGVLFSDTIDSHTTFVEGSVKTTPLARNDGPYSTVGNVQLTVDAASGLLANDNDPDGSGVLTLSAFDAASTKGGSVTVNADGSFTYNPPAGFSGPDSFTYTIQDLDGNSDQASVTISVGQVVWFINNNSPGPGDGRFTSPFSSIQNFNTLAADEPGDYIFIYQGLGSYTGGLTLLNSQQLIGHGVGLDIAPNLAIPAASRPQLSNNGNGITLGQNNTIRGLNIANIFGTGISGSNFGTLTIGNLALSTSFGTAINLSNGSLAATFDRISANNANNGIILDNTTGSFSVTGSGTAGSGGQISEIIGADPAGNGILLKNSSGDLNFNLSHIDFNMIDADAVRMTLLSTANANIYINNLRVLDFIDNDSIDLAVEDNAVGNILVQNSTFQSSFIGTGGVILQANDNSSGSWQILNNIITSYSGSAIVAASFANAHPTAVIANNNVDFPFGTGDGIRIIQEGNGTMQAFAENNLIRNVTAGILARARNGSGRLDLRLRSNTITDVNAPFYQEGTFIEAGASSGTHTNTLCLNIGQSNNPPAGGNSSVGALGADGYYLNERPGTTVLVQGMNNGSTAAQVDTFIQANNTGTALVSGTSFDGGVCNTPVQTALLENLPALASNADGISQETSAARIDLQTVHKLATQALRLADQLAKHFSSMFHGFPAYASGESVEVNVGTINPGQQITVTFDVTIDAPFSTDQVCNQGSITGSNFSAFLTDDPDVAGGSDATCTTVVFTDDVSPDTSITDNPPALTNSSSASFEFTGTDNVTLPANLAFECELDGGGFSACTSPQSFSGLDDGEHTFQVRAKDEANNIDATPASYQWTVDATPPDVTINQAAGQADPSSDSPINFTAVFSEPVTGFAAVDVSLDGTAGVTTVVITELSPHDGTTYNVAVSGMSGDGDVTASIPADAATDAAGNGNTASTSADNTVTFIQENQPPEKTYFWLPLIFKNSSW